MTNPTSGPEWHERSHVDDIAGEAVPRLDRIVRVATSAERWAGELLGLVRAGIIWAGLMAIALGVAIALGESGVNAVWPEAWATGVILSVGGVMVALGGLLMHDGIRRVGPIVCAAAYAIVGRV